MAVRLTGPGQDLARRRPRPVKRTRQSKYDWENVRKDYTTGIQNDPDDPYDMTWPTLKDLAVKYNIPESTVLARSSRERWSKVKQAQIVSIGNQARKARAAAMAKEGISFDKNALTISKLGMSIITRRLAEITRGSQQRDQISRQFEEAMERGELVDLSILKSLPDFDAKELEQLANAALRFEEMGRRVIGTPDEVSLAPTGEDEQTVSEQMNAGGKDRLVELMDVMSNTGLLNHMMKNMVQPQITSGDYDEDDEGVIDAELVEENDAAQPLSDDDPL